MTKRTHTSSIILYTILYATGCIVLFLRYIAPSLPHPYMDELFHYPQTLTYCSHRFHEWNPKITTLPGLYLTALPYTRAMHAITQFVLPLFPSFSLAAQLTDAYSEYTSVCSLNVLRALNVMYGAACVPLFFFILRKLHPTSSFRSSFFSTVQLSLFPLFFFFHFLFYTDGGSLFWTLLTYFFHLHDWRFISANCGFVSVWMRQTNIVWIGFMMLTQIEEQWRTNDRSVFGEVRNIQATDKKPEEKATNNSDASASSIVDGEKESKLAALSATYNPSSWSDFPFTLLLFVSSCFRSFFSLVARHFGLLLLCVLFVFFFVLNDFSIVVGDRAHHSLSLHLPNLCYFILFAAGMTVANWSTRDLIGKAASSIRNNKTITVATVAAMAIAVHYFTIAHPFLLADNRHYTFYLWKNLFARFHLFRYALLPVYLLLAAVMQSTWSSVSSRTLLFQFTYWLVVLVCLILTPLIEFRYFTTPFIMWFLHSAPTLNKTAARSASAILLYVIINAATLYIFVFKPFVWGDGTEARFMW